MVTQLGMGSDLLADEWEIMGERILLPKDVMEQLMVRENAIGYAHVKSVSLASFVRGVRQI